MQSISSGGRTSPIPGGDLLALVEGEVRAGHSAAQLLCQHYNLGGADGAGQLGALVGLALQSLETLLAHIEDRDLRGSIEALCAELRRMVALDQELQAVVARFANLPPPRGGRDRAKVRRRLDGYGSVGPMWLFRPAFQQLASESVRAFATADQVKRRIDVRLAQLRAVLSRQADEDLALETVRLLVESAVARAHWLALLLSSRHAYGLGDVTGQWASLAQETLAELGRLAPQIDDEALRTLVAALSVEMERLAALRDRVLEEVARSVGLTLPRDTRESEELRRRLDAEDAGRAVWPAMPSLRPLSEETVQVAAAVDGIRRRVAARLAELRAGDAASPATGN